MEKDSKISDVEVNENSVSACEFCKVLQFYAFLDGHGSTSPVECFACHQNRIMGKPRISDGSKTTLRQSSSRDPMTNITVSRFYIYI